MTRHPAAVAALLLAACGAGKTNSPITTRDSAGVTIIEHPVGAIAAASAWSLGAPTAQVIHGRTPADGFSGIVSAALLSDGRILLIDGQNDGSIVLLYDSAGMFERQLGRVGEGPGEFMFAQLVRVGPGDTLLFQDMRSGRLTWMTPSGVLIKSVELARYGAGSNNWTRGESSDRRAILTPVPFSGDPATGTSAFRRPMPVLAFDLDRERIDTLTTAIPGDEVAPVSMDLGGRSRTLNTPVGYGRSSYFVVSGSEVVVAANESSALESYVAPFVLKRSVRFADARHPVDAVARTAFREAFLAKLAQLGPAAESMRKQFTEVLDRTTIADSMPWYQEMTLASNGAVWLRLGAGMSDSTPHYAVVGFDGRLAGRADLPNGSRLLWAGANEVLIVMRDADDVERLELRPIIKTGAAR